jgi:hypothetical protein
MSVINFSKSVTSSVVGFGVTKIVYAIIDNNVVATNKRGKILLLAGKIGIGLTASAIVCREVEREFDEVVDSFRSIKKEIDVKVVINDTPKDGNGSISK